MAKMVDVLWANLVADRRDPSGFSVLPLKYGAVGGILGACYGSLSACDDRFGPGSFVGWQRRLAVARSRR